MFKVRTSAGAYACIAILLAVLSYPVASWLVQSWLSNPYYSHGFLVPAIAGLLAWRLGRHALAVPRRGNPWPGLVLAAASVGVLLWALRWHNYFAAALALIALLAGILLYLEGWARLRRWLFPLLFLAFMVPLPFVDLASPWLEAFTARWAATLAGWLGIPAVQQGGEISLPALSIVVGAPCSGLRSLVSMVTIAAAWVYLVDGRLAARALLLAAILPLVAITNVVRIALLLVVAVVWGPEPALTYYHDWSGLVLFLGALGLLLLLGKALKCSRLRADLF